MPSWTRRTGMVILTAVVLAIMATSPTARAAPPPDALPDRYIVVLKDNVPGAQPVANEHARQHAAEVSHVYEAALKGYAARIPAARLSAVLAESRVLFVSEDREVQAVGTAPLAG